MFATFFLGFCLFSLIRFSDVLAFAEDRVALLLVFKSGCNDSMCLCRPNLEKKRKKAFEMGTRKALKMPFFIKLGTKLPEENVTCRVALVVLQLVCNLQMKLQAVVLPLGQSVFIKGGPSINLYSVGCAIEFKSVFMLEPTPFMKHPSTKNLFSWHALSSG